jgi:hypothetical protein
MQDWQVEYELVDRKLSPKDVMRRSANFKNLRWNRDPIDRQVLIFGVSRTVPANERSELARCAAGSFSVPSKNIFDLTNHVRVAVTRILGKDVTGYKEMVIRDNGRVKLLTGITQSGAVTQNFTLALASLVLSEWSLI